MRGRAKLFLAAALIAPPTFLVGPSVGAQEPGQASCSPIQHLSPTKALRHCETWLPHPGRYRLRGEALFSRVSPNAKAALDVFSGHKLCSGPTKWVGVTLRHGAVTPCEVDLTTYPHARLLVEYHDADLKALNVIFIPLARPRHGPDRVRRR